MAPTELQKNTYNSILKLYDVADKVVKSAKDNIEENEKYLPALSKMVVKLEKNTEVIANNFFKYMESGKVLSGVEKMKMEKALTENIELLKEFLVKYKK